MKELGVSAYRFSIAWPRIFPDASGTANPKGLEFYSTLVDEVIKAGLVPYVSQSEGSHPGRTIWG
jgi:beta-glucosidase